MCKGKHPIYYVLIFVLMVLQVHVLSMIEVYGESSDSSTLEEVQLTNTTPDTKTPDESSTSIPSITMNKNNIEVVGTEFRFTANCEKENLKYEWLILKNSNEIYRKDYSNDNFLDFMMDATGIYQVIVTSIDESGSIVSQLSQEVTIVQPVQIHSISVDHTDGQTIDTPLTFTVLAEGEDLVYHWYIFRDSIVVHDGLLSENSHIAYTPNEPGVYKGRVFVKDRFGKCVDKYSEEFIIHKKISSETQSIEAMINGSAFTSKTNHYMWVDTDKNVVYVFEGESKNWRLTRTMICTDGKASTPTVKGDFKINGRAPWLTSYNGDVKAKYKVRFFGNYYFHSILFDSKGKKIVDSRLGQSLSHGCVRLSVEDAKWVYDHIKDGTGVHVE